MANCIPLVFLSVLCLSITAKTHVQSSLYRDYKTKHGKFKSNQNQSLLVTLTKSHFLEDALECSFHCIGDSKCLSYNIAKSPDSNGIYICEVLATDKYRAKDRLQANSSFHHFSPMSPCESSPCQNSGTCIPDYEENSYSCSCPSHVTGQHCETPKPCNFDFENGIGGWIRSGTAFNNQPTYGDNPTARLRESANQQGNWWIGTFENRPSIDTPAGRVQDDAPQGYLTSPSFKINGKSVDFLVGGGCDINIVRVELVVGIQVVKTVTGTCSETMNRMTWDIEQFISQIAHVRLVDAGSSAWHHINFDDLKGDISCE
ncbi:uncharacterized protein LOC113666009 [Pocillopora damicornis]|uniref:uncharacterized protein LOC113666009 n=1 Tax=Pocillopora damicornis TaxID=46731 RepID=UPI000F54C68F|nr:uncharacterized protein LOC113666009 [Pocillopora damicornis]